MEGERRRGGGYAIVVGETFDHRIKLFGCPSGSFAGGADASDEIWELNGRLVERWSLDEVRDFLRKCVHSRALCLRIKPDRAREKVGHVTVRDTFVISVGDMTQSSLQSASPEHPRKKSVDKEVCDIQELLSRGSAMKDPTLLLNNNNNNNSLNSNSGSPAVRGHRERAVDVPDTFVAVTKTAPRYPPPRKKPPPVPGTSSLKKNGLYTFSGGPLPPEGDRPAHARSASASHAEEEEEERRRTPPTPRISELLTEEKLVDLGQRIHKYQDSLRRRKEEDDRAAQEDAFLRSSLRGSAKLRALLQKQGGGGVDNSGFEDEAPPPQEGREVATLYDPSSLLSVLHNIEAALPQESLSSIQQLLSDPAFGRLLRLHNRLQEICCFRCMPTPEALDATELSAEVSHSLADSPSPDAQELAGLLGKHVWEELMVCHDRVAASQATPTITEEEELLARLAQYAEDSIKIVRIDKTTEPLGATVKNEGEAVIVGRIIKGGIAEKSGLLHEGDEILEVNGLELRGKSVNDVCDIMASMSGTLTFLIVPTQFDAPQPPTKELVTHLKAHFDYEPEEDPYLPCRELGLSFCKGDVLHVLHQGDPSWWQAYREGEEEEQVLAGLVPSRALQHQREMMKQAAVGDIKEKKSKKGKFLCVKRPHRRKKKMYQVNCIDDADQEHQVLSYEEVRLYYPRSTHKRPLVLIGPQKVGRHELRQKLMEDTNRFAAAVPHTSRPKKDSEVQGVDYFFTSRSQFEADIAAGRFVEHGEYQKSYYGTSLEAIRSVMRQGKTCVLNLHPQSLRILSQSDLMPYVVFVAPPALEKLRLHCEPGARDSDLRDTIQRAREMEEVHGHHFDLVLVNVDLVKTLSQLLHAVALIEREPQWVPASWVSEDP